MFRVNLTVPLRLFRTKTKPLLLGCFVFVRGFAASGDKVVALLRLDLTHHPPMRMTLREKSPPISANLSFVGLNCVCLSPSPQSAPYLTVYTIVYISTAVFYSESLVGCSPSRKSKVRVLILLARTKTLWKSSYPVRAFFIRSYRMREENYFK